ncbi:MAG: Hsp33 family molecular chaperone HslO [Kofleriaceae bacterium]
MSVADHVVRAITKDGAFRVIAAVTTSTARDVAAAQGLTGDLALRLAELLTSAILVRETTQPARRVQLIWRDARGGTLVADALPDGSNRAIVNPGELEAHAPGVAGDHLLQVNYTLPNGAMHQGIVGISQGTDMATALMQYMQESESTLSIVGLAALDGPDGARTVGGYLVQLLPEATREVIGELTDRLGNLPPLANLLDGASLSGHDLVERVLDGFPYDRLADSPLTFGCTCNEGRVLQSLLTLGDDELEQMIAGDTMDVRCDACGARYEVEPSSLRAMRDLQRQSGPPN